jgi:tRNA (guanine37-N1)-methyltransferase
MKIDILSLFPAYFEGPFGVSMIKRALDNNLIEIGLIDIRDFTKDKHRRVDDRPFGGGPGMLMTAQPIVDAINSVRTKDSKVVFLSPQGSLLTAKKAKEMSSDATHPNVKHPDVKHLIILCGHYEGVDERVLKYIDEEISIGDYVLTSGCPAAVILVESVIRFIPGVLGNEDGAKKDSFEDYLFDAPAYTRPVLFEGLEVPEVLRSGNFKNIENHNYEKKLIKTKKVRPDLYEKHKKLKINIC